MRRSTRPIVIASRRSALARAQAELVGRALAKLHPHLEVAYRWIESEGDRTAGRLSGHGGKGLFTRAIEAVLLEQQADIAVHSLKDLPAADHEQTPRLTLAAIPKRGDRRDCLIARNGWRGLDDLPEGAVLGTSSPRRAAQALRCRADLRITLLRGNVDTRLRHVLEPAGAPQYDAALLAAAGLKRLGHKGLAVHTLDVDTMLPAACQGALAIQCRADDHVSLTRCLPLNHAPTATAAHAERQLVAALGADCHSAVAVLAEPVAPEKTRAKRNADAHWFRLRARVLAPDGSSVLEADKQVKTPELRRLVKRMAEDLLSRGAAELIAAARDTTLWAAPVPPIRPNVTSAAG